MSRSYFGFYPQILKLRREMVGTLHDLLNEICEKEKLSLRKLAPKIGVSHNTLANIKSGYTQRGQMLTFEKLVAFKKRNKERYYGGENKNAQ